MPQQRLKKANNQSCPFFQTTISHNNLIFPHTVLVRFNLRILNLRRLILHLIVFLTTSARRVPSRLHTQRRESESLSINSFPEHTQYVINRCLFSSNSAKATGNAGDDAALPSHASTESARLQVFSRGKSVNPYFRDLLLGFFPVTPRPLRGLLWGFGVGGGK